MMHTASKWAMAAVVALTVAGCGAAKSPVSKANPEMILVTTTSTQDTGLLDVLIPKFEEQSGFHVKTIALGSGEALARGERGEADAILSHAPSAEVKLVDSGVVTNRHQVMHNDFVVVGPATDPAGIKAVKTAKDALQQIANAKATFVSRGDDSGTHKKEKELWASLGVKPSGSWYVESGTGMGKTLLIASERNGYTLSDRGTYLAQKQHVQLSVLLEGDQPLLNVYHVMQVNPAKFSKVNGAAAEAFVTFMQSTETQKLIGSFGADKYGQPLFFPDVKG